MMLMSLHSAKTQKSSIIILTAMKTSNLMVPSSIIP
jgi:hypothetical protein